MTAISAKTDFLTKGKIVYVSEGIGVIRYVDPTTLTVGIELAYEQDNNTTDGILNGILLFKCRKKCGIFVNIKQVLRIIQPEELLREIIKLRQINNKKNIIFEKYKNEIKKLKKENNLLKYTISQQSFQQLNNIDNNNNNDIIKPGVHYSQNSLHSSKSRGSLNSTPKKNQSNNNFGFPNTKRVNFSDKSPYPDKSPYSNALHSPYNNNKSPYIKSPYKSPYQDNLDIGVEIPTPAPNDSDNESYEELPTPAIITKESAQTIGTSLPSLPAFSRLNSMEEDDEKRMQPNKNINTNRKRAHSRGDHSVSEANSLQIDGYGSVRNLNRIPQSNLINSLNTLESINEQSNISNAELYENINNIAYNNNDNINNNNNNLNIKHKKKQSMIESVVSHNSLYSYHSNQSRKSESDEDIDNNNNIIDDNNDEIIDDENIDDIGLLPDDPTLLMREKSDFLNDYNDHLYGEKHSKDKIELRGKLLLKGLKKYQKKKEKIQLELLRQENELKKKREERKKQRHLEMDLLNKKHQKINNNINNKNNINHNINTIYENQKSRNSQSNLIDAITKQLTNISNDPNNRNINGLQRKRRSISAPASPVNEVNLLKKRKNYNFNVNLKETKLKRSQRLKKWLKTMDERLDNLAKQGKFPKIKKTSSLDYNRTPTANDLTFTKIHSENVFDYASKHKKQYSHITTKSHKDSLNELNKFAKMWNGSNNENDFDDDMTDENDQVSEIISLDKVKMGRKSISQPVSPHHRSSNNKIGRFDNKIDMLSPIQPYTLTPQITSMARKTPKQLRYSLSNGHRYSIDNQNNPSPKRVTINNNNNNNMSNINNKKIVDINEIDDHYQKIYENNNNILNNLTKIPSKITNNNNNNININKFDDDFDDLDDDNSETSNNINEIENNENTDENDDDNSSDFDIEQHQRERNKFRNRFRKKKQNKFGSMLNHL